MVRIKRTCTNVMPSLGFLDSSYLLLALLSVLLAALHRAKSPEKPSDTIGHETPSAIEECRSCSTLCDSYLVLATVRSFPHVVVSGSQVQKNSTSSLLSVMPLLPSTSIISVGIGTLHDAPPTSARTLPCKCGTPRPSYNFTVYAQPVSCIHNLLLAGCTLRITIFER